MTPGELKAKLADVPDDYIGEIACEGMEDCTSVAISEPYTRTDCDYKYVQDVVWPGTDNPRMLNMGPVPGTERQVFVQGRVVLS